MNDLYSASEREIALASFTMVTTLMGFLAQNGRLSPDEVNLIGALSCKAARAGGEVGVAALIEGTLPSCVGVDVEGEAAARGIGIAGPTRN